MLKDYLNWIDSNGKKFTKESRLETIRKNSIGYFKIYNLNSRNELLASFFYERMLLGFSYSTTMKMVFGDFNIDIRNIDEIDQYVNVNVNFELICIVKDTLSGKSKNGNRYLKMKIFDTNINEVQMIEVDRNLTAELAEDAKAGDKISLKVRDKMPFTYALILDLLGTEKEFNSIKISRDELIAHFETLPENIKNNLRLLFEKEVKNV
jgi:hypothetical protein